MSFQENFYDKITKIKKQIHQWSWRGLSLFGKVSIIKSLLLPKLVYIFSILSPPSEFISLIQTIIYKFLWKRPDKIARRATINSSDYGGLNISDLETSIKSLRLAWILKIFNPEPSPWKSYLRHLEVSSFFTATIMLMIIISIRLFIQKCCSGGLNFAQMFQRILKLMTL